MKIIDAAHRDDFLWPEERKLMHHFMMAHEDGFAWEDAEWGPFREDFFAPIEMPTVLHKPWNYAICLYRLEFTIRFVSYCRRRSKWGFSSLQIPRTDRV